MTYDTYRIIFIAGLILSIVMLLLTVLIFFLLNIKSAIGDITGSSKRKAIEGKGKTKKEAQKKSTASPAYSEGSQTSKISPQDRYDAFTETEVEAAEETSMLSRPVSEPIVQQYRDQTVLKNAGCSIETEITDVHSAEVIQ